MSRMSWAIGTSLGLVMTVGAVQLASGRALSDFSATDSANLAATSATVVNRAAKADRGPVAQPAASMARTFSVQPQHLDATSVLVRIPVSTLRIQAQNTAPAIQLKAVQPTSSAAKAAVACEPVVSVLVEAAQHLAPGRCMT